MIRTYRSFRPQTSGLMRMLKRWPFCGRAALAETAGDAGLAHAILPVLHFAGLPVLHFAGRENVVAVSD